jgi:hypothetical protein
VKDDGSLLNRTIIAAPCDMDWDSMTGDDRIRFCGQCKLNVYSVASMSTKEAAKLIRETEGRLCLKLYRRPDGTILTDDCPVGLRRIRDRFIKCVAGALALFVTAGFLSAAQAQGLLGAAVDPRFGETGECGRIIAEHESFLAVGSVYAGTVFALLWAGVLIVQRRAFTWLLGLGLILLFVAMGFAYGQ